MYIFWEKDPGPTLTVMVLLLISSSRLTCLHLIQDFLASLELFKGPFMAETLHIGSVFGISKSFIFITKHSENSAEV